ncbi:AEC family transporter [Paralimibaculum aggregatum]|uniref:AEC family transporter n=1 Tax=Paralimibaculum aggregatum TaxID=3036245 RepID=A0ABQ6LHT8_9RHOB|nr:AEC family transporter [Limibaculum sp. NKW23]GMG81785.1 AEC family transporter [Limibaculum sp. NKW23]
MSAIYALLLIVLPVFLLVAFGYGAVRTRLFSEKGVDWLIAFATNIAVPALLFRSVYQLDLEASLRIGHLASFYLAATTCFALAALACNRFFGRRPGEAVALGFSALFSNSVLLGLPVYARAYGEGAMEPVYAIIAFHAGYCYLIGILTMEFSRRDGVSPFEALRRSLRSIFRNALTVSIMLGFAFNLSGLPLPAPVMGMIDMLAAASLPVALFGLGGVLTRYKVTRVQPESLMIAGFSLLVHPMLAWLLATQVFALDEGFVRAAVVLAAMPPGVNGYLFAAMYGRAVGAAASTVLIATVLSLLTITGWLWFLGGAALG